MKTATLISPLSPFFSKTLSALFILTLLYSCSTLKQAGKEIAPVGAEGDREKDIPTYAVMKVKGEGAGKLELPLKKTDIRSQITDTHAVTDISQVYKNDTGKKIEVLYQFPLPYEGAVTDMVVRINDRTIMGTIKEKEEARREYEQARSEGRTASLVEQERPNIFSQSIANILPDDEIVVTLRVYHPLRYSNGSFEYAFPITIGPRYMGGAPMGRTGEGWSPDTTSVPDASRISPQYIPEGTDSSHILDFEITLATKIAVKDIHSTSHFITLQEPDKNRHVIRLSKRDRIPNKDFILQYRTESLVPQFSLLTHRLEGEDGFFSITIVPPSERKAEKVIPKEIIFVLDRSGSMSGVTMEKAKEAVVKSLKKLNDEDSFNVILFDDRVERLWDRPQSANDETVREAIRYTDAVRARGGTEMEQPLLEALGYDNDAERQRIVLFITDGNVGYEQRLLGKIRQNLGHSRIFTVGIGSSVNRYLVGEVAREGKGVAEYIRQDEDVAERLSAIYRKISNPVLTDVNFDFGGMEVYEIYPEKAHDLFFEEPTTLLGRYRASGKGSLKVTANSAEGKVEMAFDLDFPDKKRENPALRYAWAKKKIDSLSLTALGNETEELKNEIIEISKTYSVLSKYTAFIAVEREIRDKSKVSAERWLIPSELPEGLRFEGFGPEVELKVSRLRPGDPVVYVNAPKDVKSVVAYMPYGETLNLEYDDIIGKFSGRFLVPYGTDDGEYTFDVTITENDGTTSNMEASYVVDSRGPDLFTRAAFNGTTLVIEAVPESDIFVNGKIEIWPDVKEVIAILPDGREVTLKLDPLKKSRWIWRWEGELQTSEIFEMAVQIKVKAVDYAGNWREKTVNVEKVIN